MVASSRFARSVAANVEYWRQRTDQPDDQELRALDLDRRNLFRAAEFGLALKETWRDTCELVLQAFPLIERRGYWREWTPVLEEVLSGCSTRELALKGRVLDQLGILYRFDRQLDAAEAAHLQEEEIGFKLEDESRLAHARLRLSELYWQKRRYNRAESYALAALEGFSDLEAAGLVPDAEKRAACLLMMGLIAQGRGDLEPAEEWSRQAVAVYRSLDQPIDLARAIKNLAIVLEAAGKVEAALTGLEEAAALLVPTDNELEKVLVEISLGTLHFNQGQLELAEAAFRRANSPYLRRWGPTYHQALTIMNLANVLLVQGRLDEAERRWRACIKLWYQVDAHLMLANSLHGLAETLVAQGKAEQAMPLYDEALTIVSDYPDDAYAQRKERILSAEREELRALEET